MAWIKHSWGKKSAYLTHDEKKFYSIPFNRLSEGLDGTNGGYSWLYHMAQKTWITNQDLIELKNISKSEFPQYDWDAELELAINNR